MEPTKAAHSLKKVSGKYCHPLYASRKMERRHYALGTPSDSAEQHQGELVPLETSGRQRVQVHNIRLQRHAQCALHSVRAVPQYPESRASSWLQAGSRVLHVRRPRPALSANSEEPGGLFRFVMSQLCPKLLQHATCCLPRPLHSWQAFRKGLRILSTHLHLLTKALPSLYAQQLLLFTCLSGSNPDPHDSKTVLAELGAWIRTVLSTNTASPSACQLEPGHQPCRAVRQQHLALTRDT